MDQFAKLDEYEQKVFMQIVTLRPHCDISISSVPGTPEHANFKKAIEKYIRYNPMGVCVNDNYTKVYK